MQKPSKWHLRQAVPDDASVCVRLLTELGYSGQSEQELRTRLETLASDARSRVIVAESEGRVIAVASFCELPLFHLPRPWGRITALVVDSEFRGCGVGAALVQSLEDHARHRGCGQIEVTSGAQRAEAHVFYARLGYELYAGRRFLKSI